MEHKTNIVISGYYGFDNIGDEAILYVIVKSLKQNIPNVQITVLSNNPEKTAKTYRVNSVNRWNLKSVSKCIGRCDLLISGGGSLLQDVTSNKNILYYLGVIKIAQLYRKKVVFYSQGVGPVNNKINRFLIKKVLKKVDGIFVRDNGSKQLLLDSGIKRNVHVVMDPVFGIKSTKKVNLFGHKKVGIYLREWENTDEIVSCVAEGCKYLISIGYEVYMVGMQYEHDVKIAKGVAKSVDNQHLHVVDKPLSILQVLAYTEQFDFVIGMRLHSLIMAYALNVPMIALSYDPKVENIMQEMNIRHCIQTTQLSEERLIEYIDYMDNNSRLQKEIIQKTLKHKASELQAPIRFIRQLLKQKIDIMGVDVDNVTMKQAIGRFKTFMGKDKLHLVCTPNPEIIMRAKEDKSLKNILANADLVVPDGIGVVIASKILKGTSLKERVAGFDLVQNTMKISKDKEYKYFFFGSKPDIAKLASEKMSEKYPNIEVVGYRDGYFEDSETDEIVDQINKSGANILLVGLGAPKQEQWIVDNRDKLDNIKVAVGVGGSLDVMSGEVKRAPVLFQKLGMEWFYRLISEPTRAKRMLVLPKFLIEVVEKRIKSKF